MKPIKHQIKGNKIRENIKSIKYPCLIYSFLCALVPVLCLCGVQVRDLLPATDDYEEAPAPVFAPRCVLVSSVGSENGATPLLPPQNQDPDPGHIVEVMKSNQSPSEDCFMSPTTTSDGICELPRSLSSLSLLLVRSRVPSDYVPDGSRAGSSLLFKDYILKQISENSVLIEVSQVFFLTKQIY